MDIDEHFLSSVKKRLLHPIVLRRQDDEIHLVVGGRRLSALRALNIDPLVENTHFRFIDDLSPIEAKVAELEENIKRENLFWRDHISAVGEIHTIYKNQHLDWSPDQTAHEVSTSGRWVRKCLMVWRNLNSPLLRDAGSIDQAYSILQLDAERKTAQIISEITDVGRNLFQTEPTEAVPTPIPISIPETSDPIVPASPLLSPAVPVLADPVPTPVLLPPAVIQSDFISWLETYSGPKFNLVHVDFPYNVEYRDYGNSITTSSDSDYEFSGYWNLLTAFSNNLDKFLSYSAHVVFWFSMDFYEKTKDELEAGGLWVHHHPLIWYKSDNAGIIPGRDNQYPRRVYETAFLCSRGRRPLLKSLANCTPAPLPSSPIHPSQKSDSMLRHFLSMLVDQVTDVFDPTCGSGAVLRIAEELGARRILGLDIDPTYVARANIAINQARAIRKIII